MKLKILPQDFSICKLNSLKSVDLTDEYFFLARTDEEISLVCSSDRVPSDVEVCEPGWRCFRIEGTLDFALVGILARISSLLADQGISIFAVSTYNTDYVLTKAEQFEQATAVLKEEGWEITG